MEIQSKKLLPIGTVVRIKGGGCLEGLVVDYYDELDHYVVAFSNNSEFVFPFKVLRIVGEF